MFFVCAIFANVIGEGPSPEDEFAFDTITIVEDNAAAIVGTSKSLPGDANAALSTNDGDCDCLKDASTCKNLVRYVEAAQTLSMMFYESDTRALRFSTCYRDDPQSDDWRAIP